MKAIATGRLTRSYLGKLSFQGYFSVIVTFVIISLSVYWLVFRIGGQNTVTLFSDSMYAVSSLIAAWWAFLTAYRMRFGPVRMEPRYQLAWLLIGLGLLANSLGGFDYTILEQLGYINPVPSLSDIGFTLFYLCVFAGLLVIPKQGRQRRFRLRNALDALILTLCIFGVSWFFLLSRSLCCKRRRMFLYSHSSPSSPIPAGMFCSCSPLFSLSSSAWHASFTHRCSCARSGCCP